MSFDYLSLKIIFWSVIRESVILKAEFMDKNYIISLFFLIGGMLNGQSFTIPREHYYYQVKVKAAEVIDGDSFILSDGNEDFMNVRLIGVDAPDLRKKSIPELTASREDSLFADSAAAFLNYLIEGKIIKLTFDRKLYDSYGRLLVYAWVLDVHGNNSLFVQAELLKAGHYKERKVLWII